MRAAIGRRLRGALYLGQDLISGGALRLRAAAARVADAWCGLGVHVRRRLVAALAALAALLLVVLVLVPAAPCEFPGGDACAPADEASELVPADALAYVHLNVDEETEQFERAAEVAGRVPRLTSQVVAGLLARLPGPEGEPPAFERDLEPWLGDEIAIAVLPVGGAAQQVQLLEAGDRSGAARFAESVSGGPAETPSHRGIELTVGDAGLASALVDDFLAIGTEAGVRDVIDAAAGAGGSTSLAADGRFESLREELPEERFAEGYILRRGLDELVADPAGPLAPLDSFVNAAASDAAAAAAVATDDGFELAMRSELDPDRAESRPGFFSAFPDFDPELPERIQADALAYLGFADPASTISGLAAQASAGAPGLARGFGDLARRLRRAGAVNLERELLPALGDEAAVALVPGRGSEPAPVPVAELLAAGVDEERANEALARLQAPVARALAPLAQLRAPGFERVELGGVAAQVLQLTPTVELTYAVFDSLLAIATQPAGIEAIASGEGGLDESERYRAATDELGDDVSLLAYLDLEGLVALAEAEGLAADPVYATFASDVRRLQAAAVAVRRGDLDLVVDMRLLVDRDADGNDADAPPVVEGG